jgi:hypothetical protein
MEYQIGDERIPLNALSENCFPTLADLAKKLLETLTKENYDLLVLILKIFHYSIHLEYTTSLYP